MKFILDILTLGRLWRQKPVGKRFNSGGGKHCGNAAFFFSPLRGEGWTSWRRLWREFLLWRTDHIYEKKWTGKCLALKIHRQRKTLPPAYHWWLRSSSAMFTYLFTHLYCLKHTHTQSALPSVDSHLKCLQNQGWKTAGFSSHTDFMILNNKYFQVNQKSYQFHENSQIHYHNRNVSHFFLFFISEIF